MEVENKKTDLTVVPPEAEKPGSDWGAIHCAECEAPVGHFPPEVTVDEDMDLELYCGGCKEKQIKQVS